MSLSCCLLCLVLGSNAQLPDDASALLQVHSAKVNREKGCPNEGPVMQNEGDLAEVKCLLAKMTQTTEQLAQVQFMTTANMDFISADLPYGFMTNKSAGVWVPEGLEHNPAGLRHMNLVNSFKEGSCVRTHGMEHFMTAIRRQMLVILSGKKAPTIADPFEATVKLWMDKKITQEELGKAYQAYETTGAPIKLVAVEQTCNDVLQQMKKEEAPLLSEAMQIDTDLKEVARVMRTLNVTCLSVHHEMESLGRVFRDGTSFSPTEYGNAVKNGAIALQATVKGLDAVREPFARAMELFLKAGRPMFLKEGVDTKATEELILSIQEEGKALPQKYFDSVGGMVGLVAKVQTMS